MLELLILNFILNDKGNGNIDVSDKDNGDNFFVDDLTSLMKGAELSVATREQHERHQQFSPVTKI